MTEDEYSKELQIFVASCQRDWTFIKFYTYLAKDIAKRKEETNYERLHAQKGVSSTAILSGAVLAN